jgi:hypothetical protein
MIWLLIAAAFVATVIVAVGLLGRIMVHWIDG